MKKVLAITILMVFVLLAPNPTFACDCVQVNKPNLKKWFQSTNAAIFAGEATDITEIYIPRHGYPNQFTIERQITFKVFKKWKNVENSELIVLTGIGGGDCGYPFIKGEKYFVSAQRLQGKLRTGICSGVDRYTSATKTVKQLDKLIRKEK